MSYQLNYDYTAGDIVWVVDPDQQSVHKGTCTQVDIKIYKDSSVATPPPVTTHLIYWVMLDGEKGSVKSKPENTFATLEAALAALGADIQPSNTPTPTPTPTPSYTPTISFTPSVSLSPTNTPTPTSSNTATPSSTVTATQTVTPTPSTTTTQPVTPTPTSSPTVTPTITMTPTVPPPNLAWNLSTAIEANNWQAIAYGAGSVNKWAAVASSGTNRVMTSPDGYTWAAHSASAQNAWTDIVWDGTQFIAVASSGTNRVMTSPDGNTWTGHSADTGAWKAVAFGNGVIVAIGFQSDGDSIISSNDGSSWTVRTAPLNASWCDVAWSSDLNLFAAISTTGNVMTSPDGVAWSNHALIGSLTTTPRSIAWSHALNTFNVVTSGAEIISSNDGSSWFVGGTLNEWTKVLEHPLGFVYINNENSTSASQSVIVTLTSFIYCDMLEANHWTDAASDSLGHFVAIANDGTHQVVTTVSL